MPIPSSRTVARAGHRARPPARARDRNVGGARRRCAGPPARADDEVALQVPAVGTVPDHQLVLGIGTSVLRIGAMANPVAGEPLERIEAARERPRVRIQPTGAGSLKSACKGYRTPAHSRHRPKRWRPRSYPFVPFAPFAPACREWARMARIATIRALRAVHWLCCTPRCTPKPKRKSRRLPASL